MTALTLAQNASVTTQDLVTLRKAVTQETLTLQPLSHLSPLSPPIKLAIHARYRGLRIAFVTGARGDTGDCNLLGVLYRRRQSI